MDAHMSRSLVRRFAFAFALLFAVRPAPASAAIPESLKWVRGTVASVASGTVTIQLRKTTLPVAIDDATEVMLVTPGRVTYAAKALPATAHLKAGDVVEVHYRDSRPTGTARYIWIGIALDAASISTRPGRSAAGSITEIRAARWLAPPRMTLTSGKDHRNFQVRSHAEIMDARGTIASAQTRLPPAADAIATNDRVVVTYRTNRATLIAELIRMLPARQ
jgi:hypothetical protein